MKKQTMELDFTTVSDLLYNLVDVVNAKEQLLQQIDAPKNCLQDKSNNNNLQNCSDDTPEFKADDIFSDLFINDSISPKLDKKDIEKQGNITTQTSQSLLQNEVADAMAQTTDSLLSNYLIEDNKVGLNYLNPGLHGLQIAPCKTLEPAGSDNANSKKNKPTKCKLRRIGLSKCMRVSPLHKKPS